MLGEFIAGLAWVGSAACAFTDADAVDLSDHSVRIADFVNAECLRGSDIGAFVVATIPANANEARLTRAALATLLRRRAPMLADINAGDPSEVIVIRAPAATRTSIADVACYAAARDIETGAAISSVDLALTPCAVNTASVALAYDRINRVTRTLAPLPAGAYVGRISTQHAPFVEFDAPLTLAVTVGPVHIQRPVRTMQVARAGEDAFVRDETGNVFQTPIANLSEAEVAP